MERLLISLQKTKNNLPMKKIYLLFIVFTTMSIQSQNSDKAKALLDEVHRKVTNYNNICIDFKYNLDNLVENINQETKGNVTLSKDKYVLNYLGATRIFDGNKLYTIIPENEEVIIESKESSDNTITPSQMLTFYQKGYSYKWDIEQNIRGRKIQYVELKPLKSNSEIKQILLGIDIQTKHIYNLIEVGKNNTKTTITITSFKTNQPLSDNTFKFDREKYKKEGYYISEF